MLDGTYQSLMCWFLAYLLFAPGRNVTSSGQDVNDRERLGVFVAPATITVINTYVLLNTYRWDWLMLLLVSISILLVWFWTGVYTSFTSSTINFYKAAAEIFGQASFWALTGLIIVVCLFPRFAIKSIQKVYFPYDVDIIREQVRMGKFDYLDDDDPLAPKKSKKSKKEFSASSSTSTPTKHTSSYMYDDEDQRPIYPPSVAHTTATHNANPSQAGSDNTDYTRNRTSRNSLEPPVTSMESEDRPPRPSFQEHRPRPSYDRMRASCDRIRPSYEQANDFTSAAMLTRLESSQGNRRAEGGGLKNEITDDQL